MALLFCIFFPCLPISARAADFLSAAHEAYLEGRFQDMILAAKSALMQRPEDLSLRKNLVQLLDAAYAQGAENKIDPGWRLPPGVNPLAFTLKRIAWKNGDSWQYMLWFGGLSDKPEAVAQIRLIRYPDQVVFDKTAGIGSWSETKSPAAGKTFFGINAFLGQTPPPDGLYQFELRLADDPKPHQGWFIAFNMASKTSPALASPRPNENLPMATPTFRWNAFSSAASRDYEDKLTQVSVAANAVDCEKTYVWEAFAGGDLTETAVSATGVDLDVNPRSDAELDAGRLKGTLFHTGTKELPDGSYVVDLKYLERKTFGPLQLKRYSITSMPFSIGDAEIQEIDCGR
jgi:hypothetical protein